MRAIPAVVQYLLCSRTDRCLPTIQRGYGHPYRAGAPEETTDVGGTGVGYGLRVRRAMWGMLYADDACIAWRSPQGLDNDGGHRKDLPSLRVNRFGEEDRDHVHASTVYTADDGGNPSGQENP